MNKRPYNDESISQYLLGTLSYAETERFDELSFTDDVFVDAVNVVERELLDAYVQGQLRNSLAKQFEVRYLASPMKREDIALARAFYDCQSITADGLSKSHAAARPALFSFARWRWQWGLAGLTSLILAFVAWSILITNVPTEQNLSSKNAPEQQQNPAIDKGNEPSQAPTPEVAEKQQSVVEDQRQQRSASRDAGIVSVVLSPQMRGTTNIPFVTIPANAKQVAIRLALEPNDFSAYRVVLLDQTEGDTLWRSNRVFGQSKDGSKTLNLRLPAQLLNSRSYVLQVFGLTESGQTEQMSDYHFRVVK